MRTSTIIAATVAYISVATAYPRVTRQSNVTEQWGYWTVSSPSSSHPPSGSHKSLDFLVKYESKAETAHCSASFPGTAIGIGPDQPYTACDDEAVSFTSDYNIGNVWLSQKLYQRGSVIILKGSAPLSLYGSNCTTNAVGGGTCFGPPFKVAVTSVSTQLPDNSTTIGSNSTAVDISALGEDDAAPEGATPDDYDTDSAEHGSASDDSTTQEDGTAQDDSTHQEDSAIEEESAPQGDDKPHQDDYPYGHGGPYKNSTSFRSGHYHGNGTSHGGHRNGGHDA
ncbi:hypothetical protein BKCO1_21000125 [Neofusicoccum parvum]|nr:hypothetical protein BKCO1_21000125 [Neofusicoccum parvum]